MSMALRSWPHDLCAIIIADHNVVPGVDLSTRAHDPLSDLEGIHVCALICNRTGVLVPEDRPRP